jgi:hypothetical protein
MQYEQSTGKAKEQKIAGVVRVGLIRAQEEKKK